MEELPSARIVHLSKWPKTEGYGFVLKDSKSKEYRIGSVEKDLPAESAGLLDNDIVIEVNGHPTSRSRTFIDFFNIQPPSSF